MRAIGLAIAITLSVITGVAAQSWDATTYLQSGGPSNCRKASAIYKFALEGNELVVKTPAGVTQRGAVAANGLVNVRYDSGNSTIGWTTIAGDVRSRALVLSVSGFPGCLYALSDSAPSDPATAFTGSVGDWALGRWNGLQVRNVQGVGIQTTQFSLIVERLSSGKVFCKFNVPELAPYTLWAQQCQITADTLDLSSGAIQLSLRRVDQERLEGTTRTAGGSGTLRLAR